MSFLVYLFVLLVAASSVLFGLDWMQAPLQAPPRPQQAATSPATSAQSAPTANTTIGAAHPTATAPALPLTEAPVANIVTGTTPGEAAKADANEPKPAPLCDVAACERAYHSFTAADCTYQPSWGARRLCTKGNPPRRPSAHVAAKEANAQARCNVSACESAYQSFDATTCTYQSYAGGRRLCTK